MNKIPKEMCIYVNKFNYENNNPSKWLDDYIDYKSNNQDIESVYTFYYPGDKVSHAVTITTSDDNPIGIKKVDNSNNYIVNYKNSNGFKFGNEGYEQNTFNPSEDKRNHLFIMSFKLNKKDQEPKNS